MEPGWPHLGDDVASEVGVFYDRVGHAEGDEVPESLHLVDDCISVWHVGSVIKCWRAMWADHLVNLLLNFLCKEEWVGPVSLTLKKHLSRDLVFYAPMCWEQFIVKVRLLTPFRETSLEWDEGGV